MISEIHIIVHFARTYNSSPLRVAKYSNEERLLFFHWRARAVTHVWVGREITVYLSDHHMIMTPATLCANGSRISVPKTLV